MKKLLLPFLIMISCVSSNDLINVFNPLGANAKADDPFKVLQQI